MTKIDIVETDESGAGAASLAGYEYQIDVSVWLALDLILVSRVTEVLVLEPASQEDLEATLTDCEPGRLVSRLPMSGYTLIVQAKRRGGDSWTSTTLRTLLNHGSSSRVSAMERLKDVNSRYLLVTSASANGEARNLMRRRAGVWPKPNAMPNVVTKGLSHDISGRVAVIANQDDERLRGDINRLLTEACRIPNAQLDGCRAKLREEARARIAGAGGGRWRREELEPIIREHEGYLASTPELENYVYPNNWSSLRATIAKESAAIITGQSGTGKTLATKMLYDELRKEINGLTRVPIRFGPSQLRYDTTPSPVLYDIEDPWGRFDFDPNSRPWNDQLGDVLAAARPDRMIIVTSRLDVAQASGAFGSVKHWTIRLEVENYGKAERKRLYCSRISSLPRDLQPLASSSERQVLDKLATPLEIQKFFDAMRTQSRDGLKSPLGFVSMAIDSAHQGAIEQTVIEQVKQRDDVRAAAVVWALLAANAKVTRSVLCEIENGLADMDVKMEKGISPLVDFFVAARNLRQSDDGVISYYHPRVEAGITRVLEDHRLIVRQTLRKLIDFLTSDFGPGAEWGAGTAARILARAGEHLGIKPSTDATMRVDAWLEAKLAEGGESFGLHLELAACVGSAASNDAEIARFLFHRPDKSFACMDSWAPPERSDAWYHAHASNQSTRPLLETFIRTILPHDRVYYAGSFIDDLTRLSSGLTPAFLDAAAAAVHYGYISSDDAIANGALRDIDGFEAIVDIAVGILTPTEQGLRKAAEIHLDVINEVYSDEYAEHISESDDGHTASEFLKAYVEHVRIEIGWQRIAQHAHVKSLRSYWLRAIARQANKGAVNAEEFVGAFQAGYGTKDEDELWLTLLKVWNPQYRHALELRLSEGQPDASIEQAALICLLQHTPDSFPMIVAVLVERGAANRLLELSRRVAYLRSTEDDAKYVAAAELACTQLPQPFGEICDAEVARGSLSTPVLSDSARAALMEIHHASDQVRELRLMLDASIILPIEDDIRSILEGSSGTDIAILAVKAAIRHGMTKELEAALDHRFAHVAARAITALATPLSAPLPSRLLAYATHRASPVRRAVVEALAAKPDIGHKATLIQLAGDQWSQNVTYYYGSETDEYPIARAAIGALHDLSPLSDEDNEALFVIAIGTSDSGVRRVAFQLLVESGVAMQRRLFGLAMEPGRKQIRSSAAKALLLAGEQIDHCVIDEITLQLIVTRYEPVACVFAILLGWRGDIPTVRTVAKGLAASSKRRALLLLIISVLKDRDYAVAEEIAAMLPVGHKAIAWALDASLAPVEDDVIADLGDPAVCSEVFFYMKKD